MRDEDAFTTHVADRLASLPDVRAVSLGGSRATGVTNEKRLLERAGLRGIDEVLGGIGDDPGQLTVALGEAEALFGRVVAGARIGEHA